MKFNNTSDVASPAKIGKMLKLPHKKANI